MPTNPTTASAGSSSRALLALALLALVGCQSPGAPGAAQAGGGWSFFLAPFAPPASAAPAPATPEAGPPASGSVPPGVTGGPDGAPPPAPGLPQAPTVTPATGSSGGGRGGGTSVPEPQDVVTIAGSAGSGFADGTGAAARFAFPQGLALAPGGDLIVADRGNHRIRRVTPAGVVTTVAGGEPGFADGPAAAARFDEPAGVALAADGTIYVSDARNHRVRRIAPDGEVTTVAGSGLIGDADGPGATATLDHPGAIALAPDGAVVVADEYAHALRRIAPDGTVSTLAGDGYSKGHVDGAAADARLTYPVALAIAPDGTAYFTERDSCYLRAVAGGAVRTLNPGSNYRCGFADGALADAAINNALGLGMGAGGALLIADTLDGKVREVRFDQVGNEVATLAGAEPGFRDGARMRARFQGPAGLVAAADGTIYVADAHAIRRVAPR